MAAASGSWPNCVHSRVCCVDRFSRPSLQYARTHAPEVQNPKAWKVSTVFLEPTVSHCEHMILRSLQPYGVCKNSTNAPKLDYSIRCNQSHLAIGNPHAHMSAMNARTCEHNERKADTNMRTNGILSHYRNTRREKAYSYHIGNTRYTVFLRYNLNGTIRHKVSVREVKGVR